MKKYNIYIPEYSGFCPGVKLAERNLFKYKQAHPDKKIFILGELIHNRRYIKYLEENGIKTVKDIKDLPPNSTIVIRTHGIDRNTEKFLRKNYEVIDLTCFKVKELQLLIDKISKQNFFILITGKKTHPEVIGLKSYVNSDFFIIEKLEDMDYFLKNHSLLLKDYNKIAILSQTTFPVEKFNKFSLKITKNLSSYYNFIVNNTICSITSLREENALNLLNEVDITFVIGDKISSNANKLFKRLYEQNKNVYFITGADDIKSLNLPLSKFKKFQIVSSSSTPDFVEKEVIEFLSTQTL